MSQRHDAAWGGDPPQGAAARRRLLEAAGRCVARDGLEATSVASVATEAGVSRQTVYRYFTSRDELTLASIMLVADQVRADIRAHIDRLDDPADMIVEALVLGLEAMDHQPVLRAVWDSTGHGGAVAVAFTEPVGIEWTRHTLEPAVEAAAWSEPDTDAAIEFILRVFLSIIVSPSPARSTDETRAFLYRHLVPGLGLPTP